MPDSDANLLPCSTCPWRRNKDATTIPQYVHSKACGLLRTVGEGDAFRPIMACHMSEEGEPRACRGYVAQAGWSNITVRLLLAKNQLPNPDKVAAACKQYGVELEADYPAVLKKMAASLRRDA